MGWHSHPHAYISFAGAGSYSERLGRRTRLCDASTVVLHPEGECHANVFHDAVRLLRVEASNSRLLDGPTGEAASEGCRGETLRWLCRRMLHELHAPDDVTPLSLHGLAFELIAGVTRASRVRRARPPAWLERVDALLEDSFHERLSLTAIAASAGVHPVHLARTYRQHRHRTIGERIRDLRLEHACRLLATTRETVADIAQSCGFADQSHLARLMRLRLGVSPAGYRLEGRAPGRRSGG
jgi:AraC family transcriptional regulator